MEEEIPIKNYYDKLVQQSRVDALFKPLETKLEKHSQEIEQLKFLFKNCCYNESRLMEEINRQRAGWSFPDDKTVKKTAKSMGLKKPKDKFELRIPITLWADILMFEFHAFVSNIIRCCNFLTLFKLRNVDKIKDTKYVTIGKYCTGQIEKKIKNKGDLHDFLITQYQEWIKEVSDIRNEIIHEQIIREMQGYLISSYERISEDSIKTKGDVKVGIHEYNIENLESYVSGISVKLESLIKEFFKKFCISSKIPI